MPGRMNAPDDRKIITRMKIKTLVVGPIDTNCYIISEDKGSSSFIIDAGEDLPGILALVKNCGLNVKAVLATHGHYDHVTAAKGLKDALRVPFYIHGSDAFMVSHAAQPLLSAIGHGTFPAVDPDGILSEGHILSAGGLSLKVIHTPGHSPGGVCFYCEKDGILFSGDTLFYADHGRCDLPGSSYREMVVSLKRLFELPDDTAVYPGHGPGTTIGDEKKRRLF